MYRPTSVLKLCDERPELGLSGGSADGSDDDAQLAGGNGVVWGTVHDERLLQLCNHIIYLHLFIYLNFFFY
jgi:hypothetical protein